MAITASEGSAYARVLGIGSALPSRVVDNEEMTTYIETSDEWIQQRTGIVAEQPVEHVVRAEDPGEADHEVVDRHPAGPARRPWLRVLRRGWHHA